MEDGCNAFNRKVFDKIISDPDIRDVFMVSRWALYLKGYVTKDSFDEYVVFRDGEKADALNLQERGQQYTKGIIETMCSRTRPSSPTARARP